MARAFANFFPFIILSLISIAKAQIQTYAAPSDLSQLLTSSSSSSSSSSRSSTTTTTTTSSKSNTITTTTTTTINFQTYSAPSDVSRISTSVATTGVPASSSSGTADLTKFYCQKGRDPEVHCFTPSDLLKADLQGLCPSGNCVEACQSKRAYEVIPSGVDIAYDQYGTLNSTRTEITLFGLCVDIANVAKTLEEGNVPAEQANQLKPYFPYNDNAVAKIANNITQCLPASCSMSRDSSTCNPHCRESELLSADGTTNLAAVAMCLEWLCEESCGLPFANQDVAGIGVTISYVIQVALVILCWLILLASSIHRYYRRGEGEEDWREIFLESIFRFLLVQNYFGIPLAIAAFTLNPFEIDPLNGYGLLAVCITGFLPQIWTLMMLHAYGKRSVYLSILTVLSWLLSSVVFWALHTNLMGNAAFQDSSFRSLYHIETCGGSGATALCLQTTNANPLEFLQDYYYHSVMPGLHTVPMIWAWCTFVLCVLMIEQFRADRETSTNNSQLNLIRNQPSPLSTLLSNIFLSRAAYMTASIVFLLAIAYQGTMFRNYIAQFINMQDWAFGQVIAITLWIPPLLDGLHEQFKPKSSSSSSASKKSPSFHHINNNNNDDDDTSSTIPLTQYRHGGGHHQSLTSINTAYSANSNHNNTGGTTRPTSIRVPSRTGDAQSYQALYSPPNIYHGSPDPRGDFNFDQQAAFEARYDAPASGADGYRRHRGVGGSGSFGGGGAGEEFELRSRPTMRMEEGQAGQSQHQQQQSGNGSGSGYGYEPVRRKPVGS